MEIMIINRIPTGVAIGWSFYDPDEDHPFSQIILHLAIVDLSFKW